MWHVTSDRGNPDRKLAKRSLLWAAIASVLPCAVPQAQGAVMAYQSWWDVSFGFAGAGSEGGDGSPYVVSPKVPLFDDDHFGTLNDVQVDMGGTTPFGTDIAMNYSDQSYAVFGGSTLVEIAHGDFTVQTYTTLDYSGGPAIGNFHHDTSVYRHYTLSDPELNDFKGRNQPSSHQTYDGYGYASAARYLHTRRQHADNH